MERSFLLFVLRECLLCTRFAKSVARISTLLIRFPLQLQHCKHKHIAALHTTECNSWWWWLWTTYCACSRYAWERSLFWFWKVGSYVLLIGVTSVLSLSFYHFCLSSFPGLLRPSSPPSSLWVPLERLSSCTGSWFPQRMAYPSPSTHLYLFSNWSLACSFPNVLILYFVIPFDSHDLS